MFKKFSIALLLLTVLIVQIVMPVAKVSGSEYITELPFENGVGTVIYPGITPFSITLPKSARIFIRLESNINNGSIDLTTMDGSHIMGGNIIGGATWSDAVDLPAGKYYINIKSDNIANIVILVHNSTIDDDVEPDNTKDTAQSLELNSDFKLGCLTWGNEEDLYKIVVPKDENINLTVNSYYKYLPMKIEDSNGNIVWKKDFIKTDASTRVYEQIPLLAGTYYLDIYRTAEVDNTGSYNIKVDSCNKVRFDSNGGSEVIAQSVIYSHRVDYTKSPTKSGYIFAGWYKEKELQNKFDFVNTLITDDIMLYAKWIPNIPTGVKAAAASYNSIKINWDAISGIDGYEIYRSTEFNGTYSKVGESVSSSYSDVGVETGKTYYYKMRAFDIVGSERIYGDYSSYVCTEARMGDTGNVKTVSGYNNIKVNWDSVDGADGYYIFRSMFMSDGYSIVGEAKDKSFTDTAVSPGKIYYYQVCAYRSINSSKILGRHSLTAQAQLLPAPLAPLNVKSSIGSNNSIKISWDAVSGVNGYEVYGATSSSGSYYKIGETTGTSFTQTGLLEGKSYYYKVKAYKLDGLIRVYSPFSITLCQNVPVIVPSAPAIVAADSSENNSIKVNWSGVAGANGYEIYRAVSSNGSYSKIAETTGISYINTGLTIGNYYYYKVKSYKLVGTTKVYSLYSKGYGQAMALPSAPLTIISASAGPNNVEIKWNAISGINGYELYRATASNGIYSKVAETTGISYINGGLTTGKIYYYKVRTYKLVGNTRIYSKYPDNYVQAVPIISAPTGVSAVSPTYDSIKISWNAVSGASGYEISSATTSNGNYVRLAETTSRTYLDKALTTGRTFYYKVRAYKMVGNLKVYTTYVTISAQPILGNPSSINAVRIDSKTIKLTWKSAMGAYKDEIYVSTSKNGTYRLLATTLSSTSNHTFTNTGLTKGVTYYYKIRSFRVAVSNKTYSGWTTIVSAKP